MSLVESDEQKNACFAVISCNEIGVSKQFFTSKLLPSLLLLSSLKFNRFACIRRTRISHFVISGWKAIYNDWVYLEKKFEQITVLVPVTKGERWTSFLDE